MSDKDDLFAPDEEFGDLESDDFFDSEPEEKKTPKKVKKPDSMKKAAAEAAAAEDPEPAPAVAPESKPAPEPAPTAKAPAKGKPSKAPKAKAEAPTKRASKPLTPKEKAINNIKRKAGLEDDIHTLDHLMRGKQGTKVKISDIAVFIKKPKDELLADLFKQMPVLNRVNLSACVDMNRVKVVGGQVLGASRMYQPIQVAKIDSDERLECTSGRHRLVALALLYGADAEIPVYIEDMTINEARDAVVVANMARKARAMEQAEHAALAAVGGDVDAEQDTLYENMVTTKAKAKKYCSFSVLGRSRPMKLKFALGTRKEGGLASIRTMEGFWGNSLDWHKGMPRKDFDSALKSTIQFANNLADIFQANESFDADQHMASMTMAAIGKYYKTMSDANTNMDEKFVTKLVGVVVAMGEIGRQKSEETYAAIVKAMKK
jgi:hypothetical protein